MPKMPGRPGGQALRAMTARCSVTYIGGPTALIDVGGVRLLTDPTFDAPAAVTTS